MPNAPLTKPEREFCATCGFPVEGARCGACGAVHEPAPRALDEGEPRTRSRTRFNTQPETDLRDLERAFDAFRMREFTRYVELVLASEPSSAVRSSPPPEGSGWIAAVRGALLFVSVVGEDVTLEAPIARLPRRHSLPSLRLALELCAQDAAAARVGLRGQLLLLRFTGRLSLLPPALFRFHVREIGQLAARYAGLLSATCDALPAVPEDQRMAITFELLGRARKIQLGGGPRSDPPTNGASDSIPPILAPMFSSPPADATKGGAADPSKKPTSPALGAVKNRARSIVELEGFSVSRSASQPGLDVGVVQRPPTDTTSPADRLCLLLAQAKALAPATLEARPVTMTWLIRSAVFRAVYEFRDTVPDAVAHLYAATIAGRDGPAPSRSAELAAIEPALNVVDRVVAARGQMPREAGFTVTPMTSAATAKEHVARYLGEIDKAPADPALRHYLALGALTELLVRTKLPQQTDQRLRDIVAHGNREGPKTAAIDLLMTALQRING